jgi:hypothetical protein
MPPGPVPGTPFNAVAPMHARSDPVPTRFLLHLRHDWPLAAAVLVLATLLAYALLSGAMPTNQGRILRSREPAAYWRWLRRLSVLLLLAIAVLAGSFLLGA